MRNLWRVAKDLAVERARVVRGAVVVRVLLLFGLFMVLFLERGEGFPRENR